MEEYILKFPHYPRTDLPKEHKTPTCPLCDMGYEKFGLENIRVTVDGKDATLIRKIKLPTTANQNA